VRIERRWTRWSVERRRAVVVRLTDTTVELTVRQPSGVEVRAWFDRRSGAGMRNAKGGDRTKALVQHHDWRGWRLRWADWSGLFLDTREE